MDITIGFSSKFWPRGVCDPKKWAIGNSVINYEPENYASEILPRKIWVSRKKICIRKIKIWVRKIKFCLRKFKICLRKTEV